MGRPEDSSEATLREGAKVRNGGQMRCASGEAGVLKGGNRLSPCVFVLRVRTGAFSIGGCYRCTCLKPKKIIPMEYTNERVLTTARESHNPGHQGCGK
jgi:hypothetical protein